MPKLLAAFLALVVTLIVGVLLSFVRVALELLSEYGYLPSLGDFIMGLILAVLLLDLYQYFEERF